MFFCTFQIVNGIKFDKSIFSSMSGSRYMRVKIWTIFLSPASSNFLLLFCTYLSLNPLTHLTSSLTYQIALLPHVPKPVFWNHFGWMLPTQLRVNEESKAWNWSIQTAVILILLHSPQGSPNLLLSPLLSLLLCSLPSQILGEMVNLQKVNWPKSQPEHKIIKMLWLVFLVSWLFWQIDFWQVDFLASWLLVSWLFAS